MKQKVKKSGHSIMLKIFKKTGLTVEKAGLYTHQRKMLLAGLSNPLFVPNSGSESKK